MGNTAQSWLNFSPSSRAISGMSAIIPTLADLHRVMLSSELRSGKFQQFLPGSWCRAVSGVFSRGVSRLIRLRGLSLSSNQTPLSLGKLATSSPGTIRSNEHSWHVTRNGNMACVAARRISACCHSGNKQLNIVKTTMSQHSVIITPQARGQRYTQMLARKFRGGVAVNLSEGPPQQRCGHKCRSRAFSTFFMLNNMGNAERRRRASWSSAKSRAERGRKRTPRLSTRTTVANPFSEHWWRS